MSWIPALLGLCALYTCCCSELVVTQPPSVSVATGGSCTLSCSITGGKEIGGYHMRWYQQKPDNPPRYLLRFTSDSDKYQGSGVSTRFSGSKDISKNIGFLTITGVKAEDGGVYHCNMEYAGSYMFIFGGGTQLNVLTGETKAPTLSIFPPSQEEVEKDKSTVVCLYQDFYPASLDVTWTVGGQTITNGVEKSRATKQSENNLFMASSYLSLPTTDWSTNKEVTCQVTHQGKSFAKSVKKSECV